MSIGRGTWRAPVVGYGWLRLLAAAAVVGIVGLLHTPEVHPSGWDWLFTLVSAALMFAGGRFPLAVTLLQCAVVGAGVVLTWTDAYLVPLGSAVPQLLACAALGELALRRPGLPTWAGGAAVAVACAFGSYRYYPVAANALMVLLKVGFPVLLGCYVRSQRELAGQAEQRAVEAERSRAWEVTAARTAERAAIAHELHDVVAHHVAAIVLRVGVARHVANAGDPRVAEVLDDVHAIGGEALADLRRLVGMLRDPETVGDVGLLAGTDLSAALAQVLDRTRQAGLSVHPDIDEPVLGELDTVRRHAVLRVVQEGLTNVLKHAGPAATAWVTVRPRDGSELLVEVRDDGSGAANRRPAGDPGHGLIVMRERVEVLGGGFEAGRRGSGWAVRAVLPVAVPARASA
ncbi:sensor histidine kinase [Pseudonocardia acaciae]|uniref:sensor histidine kinase n=1 Tax=Pseudonocardia acaciae TaxID=551276 RepID=UPI00068683E5|nr:histidine kinase [Pseudonocardia acaciae]